MPVTCTQCRYDLTGTPRDGRCPECGGAAQASYEDFERTKERPPLHAAAWAAMLIAAIGALSAVVILFAQAIRNYEPSLDHTLFYLILVVWNVSPFAGLAGVALIAGRRRGAAIATLVGSIGVLAFTWWWYAQFFKASDPLAGMIFLGVPAMAWVAVAPALLIAPSASVRYDHRKAA